MSIEYFDKDELIRWFRDGGDLTHRLNYKLNKNSIVFDIGGYDGEWSNKIYAKYKCKIHIFEPIDKYFNLICDRFNNNEDIKTYKFAVSNENKTAFITNDSDASSLIFNNSYNMEEINIKDINDVIDSIGVDNIDLMKINIEGSEYDLMYSISELNIIKIDNFQIQFHKIGDNPEKRRDYIRDRLSKTHKLTYDYRFVWENWKRI